MKKKKIFLGLAIASAALFSLAACNAPAQSGTSTSTPTASASEPAASTTSTPAASSSVAEATEFAVKVVAKFSDKTTTETLSNVNVASGAKIDRPNDTVKEGYVFVDYFTNSTLTAKFDFANTAITKATTIYAYYDNLTDYNAYKTSKGFTSYDIDEKFTQTTTLEKSTDFGTTARLADGSKNDAAVNITGLKAELTPAGSDKGCLMIDFGGKQTSSTINGYLEFELAQLDKDIFLEVYGDGTKDDGTTTSKWKIVRLGLASDKTSLRIKINNDADEVASTTSTKLSAGKKYKLSYEIDCTAKTVKIFIDGKKEFEVNYASTSVTAVNGIGITNLKAKDGDKVYVDNVLVKIEQFVLADAIATAKAQLDTEYTAFKVEDKGELTDTEFATAYADVDTALTAAKALMDTSTDAATVASNKTTASANLKAAVDATRTARKAAAKAAIEAKEFTTTEIATAEGYGETDPAAQLTSLKTKATAALEAATIKTLADINEIAKEFDVAAADILKEKVVMTINYYAYGYFAAEGLTEFAQGVTYYTQSEGEFKKVGADATFDSSKQYYVYEARAINVTPGSMRIVKGGTMAKYIVEPCTGYKVVLGVYTNAACTTQLTDTQTFDAAANLYAVVSNTVTWNCREIAVSADMNTAVTAGTELINDVVETSGTVTIKLNSDKDSSIGYELAKSKGGKLVIKVDAAATITFSLGSTGSGNETTKVKLLKGSTVVAPTTFTPGESGSTNTSGEMTIKTTDATLVTYTLEAGQTYELVTEDTSRGIRVQKIELTYTTAA